MRRCAIPDLAVTGELVAEVRAFNRFYTRIIGVLGEGFLRSPYSLTEARVLFEVAQQETTEVPDLRRRLGIDAGYLSRILGRFEADGLVVRGRSAADARRQVIRLTARGRAAFEVLDARSAEQIAALLSPIPEEGQRRLVVAMGAIREVIEHSPPAPPFRLRPPGPGDLGWVVQRHGALYAQEYGWDVTFEALIARIVAEYVDHHDPAREAAWVADVEGQPVGCVLCVKRDERVAQLRLLLVEPAARGMGVGTCLVEECLAFAGRAGYEEIRLWTNDILATARRIYERAGFELVEETPHDSFGRHLVGQTWRRALP